MNFLYNCCCFCFCFCFVFVFCPNIWTMVHEGELFANTAGGDFTPHVVTVSTGEVKGLYLSCNWNQDLLLRSENVFWVVEWHGSKLVDIQDVAGKILSFAQKGPRGVCVLSANGAVSNVTIRQPGSSGGILTYEACLWSQIFFLKPFLSNIFFFVSFFVLRFLEESGSIVLFSSTYERVSL